jgi:uncharacterized protein (UPF0332 family)
VSLAHDLVRQAEHLATKDPTKPLQASLRRAVSTAYYAVFHLLIEEAVAAVKFSRPFRSALARNFTHGEMKTISVGFASGKPSLPPNLVPFLSSPLPGDLIFVAGSFIQLQSARHGADYDLTLRLDRSGVQSLVSQANLVFTCWRRLAETEKDSARVYLFCLLFPNLSRRW